MPHLRLLLALALALAAGALPTSAQANPKYAAIVVDGTTGAVLHASRADQRRYPASLAKIMTLYIAFEEMDAGRLSPATPIAISANAARQPASKLGLPAGATLPAEKAILALVVKSANDIATATAEHIAGSEPAFAERMTATAGRLGMNATRFANASGLPDESQYTTARDMALLGRRIRLDFPHHYPYFSHAQFSFRGKTYRGHNRLVRSYEGADGIKTGYIRASGFNLVSSVERDGRRLLAVVMGGRTAKRRDDHSVALLNRYLPLAVQAPQYHAELPGGPLSPLRSAAAATLDAPRLPKNLLPFSIAEAAPLTGLSEAEWTDATNEGGASFTPDVATSPGQKGGWAGEKDGAIAPAAPAATTHESRPAQTPKVSAQDGGQSRNDSDKEVVASLASAPTKGLGQKGRVGGQNDGGCGGLCPPHEDTATNEDGASFSTTLPEVAAKKGDASFTTTVRNDSEQKGGWAGKFMGGVGGFAPHMQNASANEEEGMGHAGSIPPRGQGASKNMGLRLSEWLRRRGTEGGLAPSNTPQPPLRSISIDLAKLLPSLIPSLPQPPARNIRLAAAAASPTPTPAATEPTKSADAIQPIALTGNLRADGWSIQLGAHEVPEQAEADLRRALSLAPRALQHARPSIHPFPLADGRALYWSGFSGFPDLHQADTACARLREEHIWCIATSSPPPTP